MKRAVYAFGISFLLMFISLMNIFSIVTAPGTFVLIFTFGVISTITGLAFWNGPQDYMIKISEPKHRVRTLTLFGSMLCSLFFSLVYSSYILSLVFCILEFNAIRLFFCNTFPIRNQAKNMESIKYQAMGQAIKSQVNRLF